MLRSGVVIRCVFSALTVVGLVVFLIAGVMCCCTNGWCDNATSHTVSEEAAEPDHTMGSEMDHSRHAMGDAEMADRPRSDDGHTCNCAFGSAGTTHGMAYHFTALVPGALSVPLPALDEPTSVRLKVMPPAPWLEGHTPPPELRPV